MSTRKMILNINGAPKMIICDPERDTLADVIRRIGLTGTKVGCGVAQCGACSVIVDGEVIRSCVKKMKNFDERSEIVTIEGIGTPLQPHPLQQAWVTYGGVQCGFCSPGFIVSAKALLDKNPSPTRNEVRDWFKKHHNACRCTGYKPLVDAVMEAAKVMRGELTMEDITYKVPEDGKIYGTPFPRPIAMSKATGTCDFGDDIGMKMPDVLHLAVVLSGVSHGKIKSIDYSEAEKMPGVVKVITAKDVKGINKLTFGIDSPRALTEGFDHPIIANDIIYRYGDAVAVVAAETRREARDAAAKVKVDIEQLPEYMSALEAVSEDAARIHEDFPNCYLEIPIKKGEDTRKIIEESPYVVEGSFHTQRQPHLVIEPDTNQAYFDEDGNMVIHCKTLALPVVMGTIAAGIGLTPDKIRVIENPTGASFGYSLSPTVPAITAVAAIATGRPVTITLSYEEHQHMTGKRAPGYTNAKFACDENGKMTAIQYEIAYDKGAYSETADVLIQKGARFMGAPYYIPNARGVSKAIASNHNFSTAYKGFGSPQIYACSEQLIDMLAEKAGMDPWVFRYANVYRDGDTSLTGNKFNVYPMTKILEKMKPLYDEAKKRAEAESTPEFKRGVGLACGEYNVTSGPNDHAEVALELNPDGTITHFNTWEDQGQGSDAGSILHTHEALRPLGIRPDQIKLVQNDTGLAPITGPAAGSRSHYMAGNATIDAANKLMDAMRKPDGTFRTYDEMKAEGIPTKYLGIHDTTGTTTDLNPNTGEGNPTSEYTFGLFMAEVEVEVATGKTKVLGIRVIADVGVVANPVTVKGQGYGGMEHGIGMALSEDYEDIKKHATLSGAGFPFINVVPDAMEVDFVVSPRPTGPQGSCGCAELFQSAPHAAVANAIAKATGARMHDFPITPDKILAELDAMKRGETTAPDKYYLGTELFDFLEEIEKNPL